MTKCCGVTLNASLCFRSDAGEKWKGKSSIYHMKFCLTKMRISFPGVDPIGSLVLVTNCKHSTVSNLTSVRIEVMYGEHLFAREAREMEATLKTLGVLQ